MSDDPRYHVVVTEAAAKDLRSVAAYLAEHRSPGAAVEWTTAMLDHIGQLECFPERGPVPRELEALGRRHYRQALFGRYRIFYRVADDGRVLVFLIVDGRRDVAALLRDRLLATSDASDDMST